MEFVDTKIEGVFIVKPRRFQDERGYFSETFKAPLFVEKTGVDTPFIQDNFSYSARRGTVRGLHYQAPPFAQGKLVRCGRGEIMDVAVDVRPDSKTYGQHVAEVLSAENGHQLWVPAGFLHGFSTLTDDCDVIYKVTAGYSQISEGSVLWNDPALGIDWGITEDSAVISDKDMIAPIFSDWKNPF